MTIVTAVSHLSFRVICSARNMQTLVNRVSRAVGYLRFMDSMMFTRVDPSAKCCDFHCHGRHSVGSLNYQTTASRVDGEVRGIASGVSDDQTARTHESARIASRYHVVTILYLALPKSSVSDARFFVLSLGSDRFRGDHLHLLSRSSMCALVSVSYMTAEPCPNLVFGDEM